MTLKRPLRSTNDHLPATVPQSTLTKLHSPLHLPEILCIIFSFVNQYTLKNSIRYVCKQWLAIARPFIYNRLLWHLNPYPDPLCDQTFLDRLHQVAELRISFERCNGLGFIQQSLDTTLDKIKNLREMNQLRITKLVLYVPNHFKSIVYPLLSSLSTLTDLDLVGVGGKHKVCISMILALCPKLRSLNMGDRQAPASHLVTIENSIPPGYESIAFQKSGIENLTIRDFAVRQDILETILKKCPQLKTLRLYEINRGWNTPTYDRPSFFTAVAASCPLLQSIHLSILGEQATIEASRAMIQTFAPGIQLPVSRRNDERQHSYRHYHQSSLNTISVLEKDVTMSSKELIFAPFYDDFFKNTITNLEISCSKQPYQAYNSSHVLHEFLCSAPSLLSLIAPSISYFAEYFDLSGRTDSKGQYSPRSCALGHPVSYIRTTKRIWACRGLQTLNISIKSEGSKDYESAENSRIMFGYIAKVCPNLRQLSIYRLSMNLKLEGGFCLLRQLKFLTQLTILTWTQTDLEERDIEWMMPSPSAEKCTLNGSTIVKAFECGRLAVSFLSSLSEIRANKASETSSKSIIKELDNLGSISNVEEYLKQIVQQRDGENYGCWPLLDFLGICLTLVREGEVVNPEHFLPAMISEIRPGLDFSCNYSEWPQLG